MAELTEKHPYIYHYTDFGALMGMLENNEIWASHIKYQNDESEYLHAKALLSALLEQDLSKWMHAQGSLQQTCFNRQQVARESRVLATPLLEKMYNIIRDDFYTVSLCGNSGEEYIRENGLLSQWRAYGGRQSYMIAFNTEKLRKLAEKEERSFAYSGYLLDVVVYSSDQGLGVIQFGTWLQILRDYFMSIFTKDIVENEKAEIKVDDEEENLRAINAFVQVATRYKHRGFSEEQEVRMVFGRKSPPTLGESRPEKKLYTRLRNDIPLPYIKLFGEGFKLPIEKIVVGPNKDKHKSAEALRKIVGSRADKIKVTVSDIPYV